MTSHLAPGILLCVCFASGLPAQSATDSTRQPSPVAPACAPSIAEVPADSLVRPGAPLVSTPDTIRGLYVNRWAAIGGRMWDLVGVARRTEVNALVIDVKDDRGLTLYRSEVPLAREIGADTVYPMRLTRVRAVLDSMHALGIYPIARIVVVKDPLLARAKPEWAVKLRSDPSRPWLDENGSPWLDPHHEGVWRYAAELACEAVAMGFAEVQLDYVRFPDEKAMWRESTFPLAGGRTRAQLIREQLLMMREWLRPLGVPLTADVFGLTTSDTTDMGIGQRWEEFIDAVDVVLPMTYPSHYAPGSYGIAAPNARPYQVIDRALEDAKRRSAGIVGAAKIIPWYQDFTLGAPRYGVEHIRAQIQAGEDNGIPDWILWNPGSRYTEGALRVGGRGSSSREDADNPQPPTPNP